MRTVIVIDSPLAALLTVLKRFKASRSVSFRGQTGKLLAISTESAGLNAVQSSTRLNLREEVLITSLEKVSCVTVCVLRPRENENARQRVSKQYIFQNRIIV